MGGCCSSNYYENYKVRRSSYSVRGYFGDERTEENESVEEEEEEMRSSNGESESESEGLITLKGSSHYTSMYTQQGRKGINQDAMTIWERYSGEKGMLFCGVFDGHGPDGHKVSRHVRDNLPSKLSKAIHLSKSKLNPLKYSDSDDGDDDDDHDKLDNHTSSVLALSSWEACFIKSFKEMDEELRLHSAIDTFCSGSTAVTVVKQGDKLIIANLGDSRAILCTRGDKNQLIPIQLTVDLKPDIPSESERIKNCKGRVFAADEEPDVYRIWMPDDDCPGLAMARAFGDFCLKDYGLISIPDVSYRRITKNDEFVVLATDGVWDALTNSEVIRIVASARKRSMAARMVVKRAVRAWGIKYPGCKVDDCAVVCLFFKDTSTHRGVNGSLISRRPSFISLRNSKSRAERYGCDL